VQVLALLEEGEGNRHVGSTRMNEGSSRSHTVFRMVSPPAAWGVHACFSLCC
jgi:centromeric protein E